jgi:hypothetical protein
VKAQEPGPIGPARCYGGGSTGGWNGKWANPGGNTPDVLREGKPPKGESQERCRCEKKPARDRREKAVKRVAKP